MAYSTMMIRPDRFVLTKVFYYVELLQILLTTIRFFVKPICDINGLHMVNHLFYSHLKFFFIAFKKRTQFESEIILNIQLIYFGFSFVFLNELVWVFAGMSNTYRIPNGETKRKTDEEERNNLMWINLELVTWPTDSGFRLFSLHVCKPNSFFFFYVRPQMIVNRKLKEFTNDCTKNPFIFFFRASAVLFETKVKWVKHF